MALRRRARGWALAIPFALLALYAVQPSNAFEYATGSRSVTVGVVDGASAYNAVTGGACSAVAPFCTITITNKADTSQTYTVTLTQEESDVIGTYEVGGGSSVSSGPTSTPSEVAVGSSTTLTANINIGAGTRNAYWTIEGSKAGVLNSQMLRYKMTIG